MDEIHISLEEFIQDLEGAARTRLLPAIMALLGKVLAM